MKRFQAEYSENNFSIVVRILSQGREDFQEECLSNDDSFKLEDWINAFEWITVSVSCKKCGLAIKKWLDFETM